MITPAALALILEACAPTVSMQTQAALVRVESSGNAFAILDDNTRRAYTPRTYRDAVLLAEQLISDDARKYKNANRGVDVGITQINSLNFEKYSLTPALALDPCMNMRVGSFMLTSTYQGQYNALQHSNISEHDRQQIALSRSLQIYNSGAPSGDQRYVAQILLAANGAFAKNVVTAGSGFPSETHMQIVIQQPVHHTQVQPTHGQISAPADRFHHRLYSHQIAFQYQANPFIHSNGKVFVLKGRSKMKPGLRKVAK